MRWTLALMLVSSGCVPRSLAGVPNAHAVLHRDGASVGLSLSCSALAAQATLNGVPMEQRERGGPAALGRALAGLEPWDCRRPRWSGRAPTEAAELELRVRDETGEFVVQVSDAFVDRRLEVRRANGEPVAANSTVFIGDDDTWGAQLVPRAHIVDVELRQFAVDGEVLSVVETRKLPWGERLVIPAPVTAGRLQVRVRYQLPFRCAGPHGLTCSAEPRTCVDCAQDVVIWTVNVTRRTPSG